MAPRTFDLDLLAAFFAVNVEECRVVAIRTVNLKSQTARRTARIILSSLGLAFRTSDIDR